MTPEEFQRRLKSLEKEFQQFYIKTAPRAAGIIAVRLFKENFQKEGFFGEKWQEVKRRQESSGNVKKLTRGKNKGELRAKNAWGRRKILTGATKDLGRSITYKLEKEGSVLIYTDPNEFTHSKEPYGRVHNEGLRAGRGDGFIMPKRQFAGEHPILRKAIVEEIERKLRELTEKLNG
jgi:phage gpG-like protein